MSQPRNILLIGIMFMCIFATQINYAYITVNSQNDPYPPYSTPDPHTYFQTSEKLYLKGLTDNDKHDNFTFSFSPFGQNACKGKDICSIEAELGDLQGKWAMIAMLFGATPEGYTLAPALVEARETLFPGVPLDEPIEDAQAIDAAKLCGFFSAPLQYRKRGLRLEFEGRLIGDMGLQLQLGFVDISQNLCCCGGPGSCASPCPPTEGCCSSNDICAGLINLTNKTGADCTTLGSDTLTKANINDTLMDPICIIAEQICTNIDPFNATSVEDIRPSLFWRHAYVINNDRLGWPQFLITPFLTLDAGIMVGKERKLNHKFALPFGSNHHSIGASAGFNIDFPASVELGCQISIAHFFPKDFCRMPMPTSCLQSGLFPFCTDVRIAPGRNWNFSAKMSAYHFLERLSFYFQYALIQHDNDKICLKCPDPAFKPDILEDRSNWKVQVANIAFNYDLSPNIALGFLWQAPITQNNAYRSTTVMWCALNITL